MLTFKDVYDDVAGCGDHPDTQLNDEIAAAAQTIIAMGGCNRIAINENYDTCGSYCDTQSFAVAILADGRYAVATESSDSTGHG